MNLFESYQKKFKKYLQAYIESLNKRQPKELYAPPQYILQSDAKHIRPILCLMSSALFNKKPENALPAALSIELFHNFSLIHDDILDDASMRRGKKTIHKKWNTNIAILSGDVLLIESYKQLRLYDAHTAHTLLTILTSASIKICEGQQEDMNFEHQKKITSAQYIEMIRKKTAVLIGISLQMGAIVANAPVHEQRKLYKIGENIGIAFQIMDDYLDTFGNTETFGKKIGTDILSNKKTFLLTKALELANRQQKKYLNDLLNMPPSDKKIQQTKELFQSMRLDILALQTARKYHQQNEKLFRSLHVPNTNTKQQLQTLSDQLITRTK